MIKEKPGLGMGDGGRYCFVMLMGGCPVLINCTAGNVPVSGPNITRRLKLKSEIILESVLSIPDIVNI